jgi:endonuclease YncB( thermonuclease family)
MTIVGWMLWMCAFAAEPRVATVARVYDGDTLTLDTGEKIRLRLVNTPELQPPQAAADAAREATSAFVSGGPVTVLAHGRDAYGRSLADLRVGERDLATHLLANGLAHVFVIPPANADLQPLLAAEARARQARIGIWREFGYQGELHITSFHPNAPGDDREHINGEALRVCNISGKKVQLRNFALRDASGEVRRLPALTLPAGYTVRVHAGVGENEGDERTPYAAYLGSKRPIWNNQQETVELLDARGRVIDRWKHSSKGAKP